MSIVLAVDSLQQGAAAAAAPLANSTLAIHSANVAAGKNAARVGVRSAVMTLAAVVSAVTFGAPAAPARAQLCNVPAGVPTVQRAVSDPACAQVALAAGSYDESVVVARTVTITGAGAASTQLGRPLVVAGVGTALAIGGVAIDVGGACYRAPVVVKDGATLLVAPGNVLPIRADGSPSVPCPLFDDGYESATSHAWSTTVP